MTVINLTAGQSARAYREYPQAASLSTAYKTLSYRRGTARCVVSVEILSIATQQCRNYLYDKS